MLTRLAPACLALLAACTTVIAEPPDVLPAPAVVDGDVMLLRAEYSRELWVGLPPADIPAEQMLSALREVCDDTTSVAVLDLSVPQGLARDALEHDAALALAVRGAVRTLGRELGLRRNFTRVVMVAAFESALVAVDAADAAAAPIEGLVLLDPPVSQLTARGLKTTRRVGVDVLLHPRSHEEWERESGALRELFHPWSGEARVLRGDNRLAGLRERLRAVRAATRDFRILDDGADGDDSLDTAGLMAQLRNYDVVLVGELHGNPGSHRLQYELLRAMQARGGSLALATEQFERDVQEHLDAFLAGSISEDDFLSLARPWPNHADYRPLLELCRAAGTPMIAGNIPRRLANRVFREGPAVLDDFSEQERAWTAAELRAGPGAYRDKFLRTMGAAGDHAEPGERMENLYNAQAIKDDTMAESIALWLRANPGGRVLHINGVFHSEGGLGIPERLQAMLPELRIAMVTCVPWDRPLPQAVEHEWLVRVPAPR
jgi:uncharacterized iron-regulated protein